MPLHAEQPTFAQQLQLRHSEAALPRLRACIAMSEGLHALGNALLSSIEAV